jgi:hypothetical protein
MSGDLLRIQRNDFAGDTIGQLRFQCDVTIVRQESGCRTEALSGGDRKPSPFTEGKSARDASWRERHFERIGQLIKNRFFKLVARFEQGEETHRMALHDI